MKPVLIISDVWSEAEAEAGQTLCASSPAGKLLRPWLAAVGISPAECYFTAVIQQRVKHLEAVSHKKDGVPGYGPAYKGKYIRAEYAQELLRLRQEINTVQPNIILALGEMPLAFLGGRSLGANRGNLFESNIPRRDGFVKAIATHHPYGVIADWKLRPVIMADFAKLSRHYTTDTFTRPSREIWIQPELADLQRFALRYFIDPQQPCGVDIETARGTITEIGFAPLNNVAIVVPFYSRSEPSGNYWPNKHDEKLAWLWVRDRLEWLQRPVFQNGLYDVNYLWEKMGIVTRHAGEDTMLLHHALQPEMKKGLGFLASVHTDEPSWKMMRAHNETLKKEDE